MAERPTSCAHCDKRLSKKQWYYRNGKFFCKQRCFHEAQQKAASEQEKPAPAAEKPAPEGKQPASASS